MSEATVNMPLDKYEELKSYMDKHDQLLVELSKAHEHIQEIQSDLDKFFGDYIEQNERIDKSGHDVVVTCDFSNFLNVCHHSSKAQLIALRMGYTKSKDNLPTTDSTATIRILPIQYICERRMVI